MSTSTQSRGSSLGKRAIALLVLLIAAWILVKVVVGFVAAMLAIAVVVVAIFAVIWAIRAF